MPTPNVTLEQLRAGIERPAGKMHKLVLHRIGAHFLELDVSFAHHSVVFLPVRPVDATEPRSKVPRPAQLVMLKHVFDYAAQHPGQKLLIAGHTDTSGSAFVNQRFSEARANSVYALLKGDRELWAKCCETRHETTDMQALLKWAAREHGFGCDPGEVDGKTGPKTISARERFRQRYNNEFSGHLKVEGPTTADDWKAFFDLLEVSLARLLGVAEGQLASKRVLLTFAKEPVLGCGEHWPVSGVGVDGLKSATNRRVDFVFIEEEGYPSLQQQTPPGYELYGMPLRFKRDAVTAKSEVVLLSIRTSDGLPVPDVAFIVTWADGTSLNATMDRHGNYYAQSPPLGPFTIEYLDQPGIRARALAARFHDAVIQRDTGRVLAVLAQPALELQAIREAYDTYFNQVSGKGLEQDAYALVGDERVNTAVEHLIAGSELQGKNSSTAIAYAEPPLDESSSQGGALA